MRLTDFWARMESALGEAYATSWAHDHVLAALGGRTPVEAIDDGLAVVDVWRAVHAELRLPARDR